MLFVFLSTVELCMAVPLWREKAITNALNRLHKKTSLTLTLDWSQTNWERFFVGRAMCESGHGMS